MNKSTHLYIALSLFYTTAFYGSILKDLAQSPLFFAKEVHSEAITALLGKMDHYADVLDQSRGPEENLETFFKRLRTYAYDTGRTTSHTYVKEVCNDAITTAFQLEQQLATERTERNNRNSPKI